MAYCEYDALLRNGTWTLVDLPPSRKAIGCKWVFRIKENPDGTVNKYIDRLVAKGFHLKNDLFNGTLQEEVYMTQPLNPPTSSLWVDCTKPFMA